MRRLFVVLMVALFAMLATNVGAETPSSMRDIYDNYLGAEIPLSPSKIYNAYEGIQGDSLLDNMESMQDAFDDVMSIYILVWRRGIDLSASSTFLLITLAEINENGSNALLDERFQVIIDKVKVLDRTEYPSTLKSYAILAEYKSLLQDPSGSFVEFTATQARLNSEFQQAIALAMLE